MIHQKSCSHCGGTIETVGKNWHCVGCGCQWTHDFEIVYKGFNCLYWEMWA